MKLVLTILLAITLNFTINGQSWRGIYKKKDCFCDNHSNNTGWYFGAGAYISKYSFQNNTIDASVYGYGYGGFIGNKLKEKISLRLGVYFGEILPIKMGAGDRFDPFIEYRYKNLNIPLSLVYKFRSDKRISPYLLIAGEANLLREATAISDNEIVTFSELEGFNQFNVLLGGGSYILFGNHFGLFIQATMDMNPFINEKQSNYLYAFTGKGGLTYHF